MYQRPLRLRRSQLAVPGSSEKMLGKAAASAADHVFCDLEDAVAPNAKPAARHQIVDALNNLDWGKKTRCVRVNDTSTEWCYEDIITVIEGAGENLDTIMVPKVMNGADVLFADKLISQLEQKLKLKKQIGIEVLIEEVEALQNVEEISTASPRLEAMIFGMGDYSASMGVDIREIGGDNSSYPGDIWHFARFKITVAARSAGIDAVDGPYANFKDEDGFRVECKRANTLGMVGKWAIHPAQIEPALDVFSPREKDVAWARDMAAAYQKAEAEGLGSVNHKGVMVDAASMRIFNNILKKADLIGM